MTRSHARTWTFGLAMLGLFCMGCGDFWPAFVKEFTKQRREAEKTVDAAYLPAAPQPAATSLPPTEIIDKTPFVGKEGFDADGYPLRRPDKAALNRLLRARQFEALERFTAEYEAAFERDFKYEYWLGDVLWSFEDADPALAPLLDEWVRLYPKSHIALAARAQHRSAVGWHFRGSKLAKDTSQTQFATQREHTNAAIEDIRAALQLRPNFTAGRIAWLTYSRDAGVGQAQRDTLFKLATDGCPACFRPYAQMMKNLVPRWGGSYEEMAAIALKAKPRVKDNPRLARLEGIIDADRCSAAAVIGDDTAAAKPACDRALTFGFDPLFAEGSMRLLAKQGKEAEAGQLAERALELVPQDLRALTYRSNWLMDQKRHKEAAVDLAVRRQLESTDEVLGERVRWLVDTLRFEGDQLRKQSKPSEAAEFFRAALMLAPNDVDLRLRMAHGDQGEIEKLKAEVSARPDDYDVRLRLDGALAVAKRFDEVIAMWDEYLTRHPDDARAVYERGGARKLSGDEVNAAADVVKACSLGMARACDVARRHNLEAVAKGARPAQAQ